MENNNFQCFDLPFRYTMLKAWDMRITTQREKKGKPKVGEEKILFLLLRTKMEEDRHGRAELALSLGRMKSPRAHSYLECH